MSGHLDSMLPPDLVDHLTRSSAHPVIRYTLEAVDLDAQSSREMPRRFQRTLLTAELPEWLPALAATLPDEFAPLRTALAAGDYGSTGGWPLLALPGVDGPPVEMEWLCRSRTSEEAYQDLREQFELATIPADVIADCLQELQVVEASAPDSPWLLLQVAEDAANEDLDVALTYLRARAVGEASADIAIDDLRANEGGSERARTTGPSFLEHFSAGERRWLDEALATAARTLAENSVRWECRRAPW